MSFVTDFAIKGTQPKRPAERARATIWSSMRQSVNFYSGDHLLAADIYLPDGFASGEAGPGIVLCNGYTATKGPGPRKSSP